MSKGDISMDTLKKRFVSKKDSLRAFVTCGCGMPSCGCGTNISLEQSLASDKYDQAVAAEYQRWG